MTAPPHPSYGSPAELPKHIAPPAPGKSKMEVMELSDLHHPNCKINRKPSTERRESESSDSLLLSPEASKATEAVEFIAEHLRNEDQYIQVSFLAHYYVFFNCMEGARKKRPQSQIY